MKGIVRYTGTKAQRMAAAHSDACGYIREHCQRGSLEMLIAHTRNAYHKHGARAAYRSTYPYLGLAGIEGLPARAFIRTIITEYNAMHSAENVIMIGEM